MCLTSTLEMQMWLQFTVPVRPLASRVLQLTPATAPFLQLHKMATDLGRRLFDSPDGKQPPKNHRRFLQAEWAPARKLLADPSATTVTATAAAADTDTALGHTLPQLWSRQVHETLPGRDRV